MEWSKKLDDGELLDVLEGVRFVLNAKRQERVWIDLEIKCELDKILAIREELNKRGIE